MIKNKVIKMWLDNFPGLSKYRGTKVYTKVGPVICGFEFISLPFVKEFRPHFVLYPLYRENIKECFMYPELMFEIENVSGPGKHNQYNLPYEVESNLLMCAINDAKQEIGFSFDSVVHISQINKLFDNQIELGIRLQDLIEAKYLFNLVLSEENAKKIMLDIKKKYKNIDKIWLSNLEGVCRGDLVSKIKNNSNDDVLRKLNAVDLVGGYF